MPDTGLTCLWLTLMLVRRTRVSWAMWRSDSDTRGGSSVRTVPTSRHVVFYTKIVS